MSFTSTRSRSLTDVTVLPGGKLLAAGSLTSTNTGSLAFAAVQYNANGTLDPSFGSGGVATVDFGAEAMAVAVQPGTGGKILLAGGGDDVTRLNSNGTLDTTFGPKGSAGKVSITPVRKVVNKVDSMVVLPDGRFILAGSALNPGSNNSGSLVLARFNANGTLDTTFGNNGLVVTSIAVQDVLGSDEHSVRVAVDASGRFIVAATTPGSFTTRDFRVARFNANGSLDTTFGPAHTGVVTTDLSNGGEDIADGLAIQADGKIVVGGGAYPVNSAGFLFALARYNPDGTLDPTFNGDGIVTADPIANYPSSGGRIFDLAIQPDGRIVTAGDGSYSFTQSDGSPYDSYTLAVVMRFNADGSVDTSYGPSGTGAAITGSGDYSSSVLGVALQPDGRLVEAGINQNASLAYYAPTLTRFTGSAPSPSPVQVGSFTASSSTVTAGSTVTLTAGSISTANAGATVTTVAFYAVNSAGVEQLLGYGTQNADGTWTLTFTVNLMSDSYTLLAVAADSTGTVSDPLAVSLNVM
jgi:uncharacterized delta-60 repeat protein